MTRLTATQLRRLNRVILALYEDVAESNPLESIIMLLDSLLPISWISVDEASLASGAVTHLGGRRLEPIPQLEERIARFCHENPVVAFALNGNFAPALRISDFTTYRQFKNTGYYHELARFVPGWRDQAALALRLPESSLGFALSRDRAFSDEELFMMELLQPHLERVLLRSVEYSSLAMQKSLTPREREVLHWVAEGKRDGEIAVILDLSVRTVEQHVAACLRKLDAETRTACVATIWRARFGPTTTSPSRHRRPAFGP